MVINFSMSMAIPKLTHYCLLITIPLLIFPHIDGLPIWVSICSLIAFIWQFLIARYDINKPHSVLRFMAVIASFALIINEYRSLQNLDAYVALLVMMQAQKVLEVRNKRDIYFAVCISFICAGTKLLYIQSLYAMAFALLSSVFFFFVLHSFYATASLSLLSAVRNIALLLLKASPLIIVLFFLFPRIPPLLVIPDFSSSAVSGISTKVGPGSISRLAQSSAPAFRVSFEGEKPALAELYWRGLVLENYNGQEWSYAFGKPFANRRWVREQIDNYPHYDYQISMLASNQPWVFALAIASSTSPDLVEMSGFMVSSKQPISTTKVFDFTSANIPLRERLSPSRLNYLRYLPDNKNPQAQALGQQLASKYDNSEDIVNAISTMISSNFTYSLNPPLLGVHAVDDFLFSTKTGYCEHYASAAALVLRAAGIPARLVVGYMGGQQNPYEDYILVRQLDAHAWLEYWTPEQGWLRYDPTAQVAPERVESGSEASLRQRNEYNTGWRGLINFNAFSQLRLWADSLNYKWSRWFSDYNQREQRSLISDLTGLQATLSQLSQLLIAGIGLAFSLVLLGLLFNSLNNNLPLSLSLLLADKALAIANIKRHKSQAVHQLNTSALGKGQYLYKRLLKLWNQVWYMGKPVSLEQRVLSFIYAIALLL